MTPDSRAEDAGDMTPPRPKAVTAASPPTDATGEDPHRPPARINTGNPRITVAFPFSSISVGGDTAALADLADLVARLAETVAGLAESLAEAERAAALRELAAESVELADRLTER